MRQADWTHRILWGVALLAVAAVVAWFVPTGYVAYTPGTTGNLASMVRVQNGHRLTSGRLLMVAIGVVPLNALLYPFMALNPVYKVLPASLVLPNMSFQQFVAINYAMMDQSQALAAVEGERLAGLRARIVTLPGVTVAGILKGGTAVGHLQVGDRITAVDGLAVTATNLRAVMGRFRRGEVVPFTVWRGARRLILRLRLGHLAGDPDPAIGVVVSPAVRYVIPRPVTFRTQNIGGPSAGMMFALAIYAEITGQNLTHGRTVAGTGALSPTGQVEAIGGVGQKVVTVADAGAQIFLCPEGNYPAAEHMAHLLHLKLKIYPVATLAGALHVLERAS